MKKKRLKIKKGGDLTVLIMTLILSLFGIVAVYSASYYFALSKTGDSSTYLKSNTMYMLLGWLFFIVLSNLDYHIWNSGFINWIILIVGMVLLAVVLVAGQTINNATRWIDFFGVFTIMPGEIIKTCLIMFLAYYYSDKEDSIRTLKGNAPVLFLVAVCFAMILFQPNLSTAGIVVMLAFGIMFIAGLDLKWLWVLIPVGAAILALVLLSPDRAYMLDRVMTAFDPFKDPLGDGYQVIQGLLAFGSGGITGVGIGKSIQKTLYLPEPQSDYILPIIGEEIGYVGVIFLMLIYLILIWRCFSVSVKAKDRYGMLLAGGISIHLALHVVLNIAVVSATFPPTGVVLPLISLGGNATILFLSELGILYNISKHTFETRLPEPSEV